MEPAVALESERPLESPEYLRMSLAAAMTLGLKPGVFYRGARLHCVNLLLSYASGCAAKCAYCGLSGKRPGRYAEKSFIRVTWPTHSLDEIIGRIGTRLDKVKRICISQVTNMRSIRDSKEITARLRSRFDVPVSLLISPTIVTDADLHDFKKAGADRIGVAIDLATPELFDTYRGKGVGGPHTFERYVDCLQKAIGIFGPMRAGSHFVTGMGETEQEMVEAIQMVQDMGGWTHLFSFYPEPDSQLAFHPMPDMDHYRRIQLARWLIDEGLSTARAMDFDDQGRIVRYGLPDEMVDKAVDSGEPFRTSGCPGYDGEVACNRPYANSRPGPDIRNYPFRPEPADIARIRRQMGLEHDAALLDEEQD